MAEELVPTEQFESVDQTPVQEPPYKKKVYDILKSNFDDFKIGEDDFYKKLSTDKNYAGKVHDVLSEHFSDFEKPKDKFIQDITFEEPVKKKDGTISSSTESGLPSTEGIDFNADPITLAKRSAELKKPTKVVKAPELDMAGMPVESGEQDVYDQNNIDLSNKITSHLKDLGYDQSFIDKVSDLPKGYENDPIWGNAILSNLSKTNPEGFERKISSLKWQAPLASAMQEKINKIRSSGDTNAEALINEIKGDNDKFVNNLTKTGTEGQNTFQENVNLIHKYVDDPEEQKKLINNLTNDASINFGDPSQLSYWDQNRIGSLNAQQSLALNFLDKTDPQKAKSYRQLLLDVDRGEVDKSNWATLAFNKNLKELEQLGNTLVAKNAGENYANYVAKANENGGVLSPDDMAKAQYYKSALDASQSNLSNLNTLYPDVANADIDMAAQNLVGARGTGLGRFAAQLIGATAKTGQSIADIVSYPFQSRQADNLDVLKAVGLSETLKPYTSATSENSLYNNTEYVVNKDLKSKIDAIKNNDNLSQSEKVDQTKQLLSAYPNDWKQQQNEGKFNIGINSIISSVSQMAANLGPYIAIEAASGGSATPSLIRQISTTLGAVTATSYSDELAAAAERNDPNPRLSALENVAVNTIAYTVGGAPAKIREAAGTSTAIGKIINKLDDASIEKILQDPPKQLSEYFKTIATKIGGQAVNAVKSAVPFQATMALKDILQGAPINSDFAKSQIAQALNFAIFSGVAGTAIDLKNINKEQKEALFLAGKNSEEALDALNAGVKNGTISKEAEIQIKNNIEKAKSVYDNVPMIDAKGKKLSEDQQSELMYLKIREGYINETIKKDIAPELKQKLEKQLSNIHDDIDKVYKGKFEKNISEPFTGEQPSAGVQKETTQQGPVTIPQEVHTPIVNRIKTGIQKLYDNAKITVLKGKNFAKALDEAMKTGNVNLQAWGGFEKKGFEESPEWKKLIENGTVKLNFDIKGLEGKPVVVINPDNMLTGDIVTKDGKTIVNGNGGINFVTKFGDVWASSDNQTASTLAKYINEAREKDIAAGGDGTIHVVVTKGDLQKSLSSHTGSKAAMGVLEHMVDSKLISLSDFRKALTEVGKKYGIDFNGKLDAKSIHKDIADKFFGVKDSTFAKRGYFVQDIIDHLAKNSESVKENIEKIREDLNTSELPKSTERKTGAITFTKAGIADAIGHLLSDAMTVGVKNSEAYATIEINHPVKVVDTTGKEGSHESYPFHIQQVNENGEKVAPKLNVLDKPQHVTDILNDANNENVPRSIRTGKLDTKGKEIIESGAGKLGSNQIGMAKGFVKPSSEHPSGINMMTDPTGKVYGFEQNGKIILNADLMNGNTPFHEAGHLWLGWAKNNRPDLHDAGMAKIEDSQYLQDVKNNPVYQENAAKLPEADRENYFKSEALAKAIGDNGEKFVTEAQKSDFKQWVKDLWKSIADHFGIRNLSTDEINNMTLDDFSKKIAADIVDNRKNIPEAETTTEENIQPEKEEPVEEKEDLGINTEPNADEDLIKMANAVHDEFVKKKFGLEALDNVISKLQDTNLENIINKVKESVKINKNLPEETRNKIINRKEGNEFDQAVLMYDLAELKGKESDLMSRIMNSTDQKEIADLQKQLMDVNDAISDNALANHILGRSASTMFRLRQLWVNKDLTIQDMRDQYMVSKGINKLTPEQEAEVKESFKTIKEAQANLDKAKKELEEAREENARLTIENEKLNELKEKADKNKKADRAKNAEEKIQKSQERVQKSLDNLKKLGGQANVGFDPKIAVELSKIAAEKVYQGVVKFDQLVKDVYDDIKDVLPNFTKEDVVNHLLYTVNKKGELEPTLLSEKYNKLKKSKDKTEATIREKVKAYEQAQAEMALKQFKWHQDRAMDMQSNKPWNKKAIDNVLAFQRFNILFYPTTFVKLIAAVGHALILKPLKFATSAIASAVTPKSIKEKQEIWGDPNLKALGAYYSAFIKNFTLASLKQHFQGIDTKEMLYGKKMMYDEFNVGQGILEMPGRSHGYIKSFIKNAEFAYAHEQQMIYNLTKMGEIQEKLNNKNLTKEQRDELKKEYKNYNVTDPGTLDRINKLSLEHGKWAILMNDTKLTDKLSGILNKYPLLKTELPIVKIPINFIGRTFAYKYGLLRALAGRSEWESKTMGGASFPGLVQIMQKGSEGLTKQQAELLGKSIQVGTMGAAFFGLGYLNRNNIKKNDDGSYEILGTHVPKLLVHSPEYESIISGAETANKYKDSHEFISSYLSSDWEMVANNPFSNFLQYGAIPRIGVLMAQTASGKTSQDEVFQKLGDIAGEKVSNLAIPGFVKQTATSFDTKEGPGFHPFGTTIKRYPAGSGWDRFKDRIEMSIPGARKNVLNEQKYNVLKEEMQEYSGKEYKKVRPEIKEKIIKQLKK